MDLGKQRSRNIDGFYRPGNSGPSRQPVFKDSSSLKAESSHAAKKPKPTPKAKVTPSYASPQVDNSSLIGMTIPQPQMKAPTTSRSNASKKRNWSRKRKVVTSILVVLVILFGLAGWFGSRILGSLDKVFHGNIFSDATALFSQGQLKGESSGRVNILIAGNSADDPGHSGSTLTDSLMVLSINTKTHTAFMLSIPRDLWVNAPGSTSYQKINAAIENNNFNAPGYPSGGMGNLEQIVQNDLGIPIDYYALVDYTAFKDAVNAVGGITININSPDPRGLYDAYTNLKLPNGQDTLNGTQALALARARGDGAAGDVYYGFPSSDFTRTMYQREMGVAIAKKATSAGVISNPLKINSLFSALSNNVKTDLNLQNVLALAQLSKGLNLNNIGSYSYSYSATGGSLPLLKGYSDPRSGQSALIPSDGIGNYAGLRAYYQQLVTNNPVTKENASVELLNGTNVSGLASNEQKVLQGKGIISVTIADASNNYSTSLIVDNSGGKDPATKALLQKLFPGQIVTTTSGSAEAKEAINSKATFTVIIGQNFANANPIASNTSSTYNNSITGSTTSGSN